MISTPRSEQELLERANKLAGMTLEEIANDLNWSVPRDLKREKGWQGQLLEKMLGTTAATKSVPDFEHLGIELKTIPVDANGNPKESTFICSIALMGESDKSWKLSTVYQKLAHVLWVPILIEEKIPIGQRVIGTSFLWRPSVEQENVLRQDWEELTDMIHLGRLEEITARHGRYLQVRPKAAHAHSVCKGVDQEGNVIQTLPRGFYLRAKFTAQIVSERVI